jgi:hypothetical protein
VRAVRGVRQCCFNCAGEIELPIAVRIRTPVFEKRPGRGIEQVRLRSRYARGRPLEPQLDAKMLECRKCRAQHLRSRPISTQLLHSHLARRGRGSELHGLFPGGGSLGAAVSVEHIPFASALSADLRSERVPLASVAPPALPQALVVC